MKADELRKMRKGVIKEVTFFMVLLLLGSHLVPIIEVRADENPGLVILPFLIEKGEDPGRGAFCPVCKRVIEWSDVPPGSENNLTRLLYQKMAALRTFNVIPPEKTEEALTGMQREEFKKKPVTMSFRLGRGLGADFILVGFLFRFEERIGSSLGVERPASVGFDLHLFRLRDEKMVWEGRFNETQRPLSENLLEIDSFFKRKASWVTAEALASGGMDELLKKLPAAKELQEK
jgi:hypothetical protein